MICSSKLILALGALCLAADPQDTVSLKRTYRAADTLRYEMKGSNRGWEYQIQADSTVKSDTDKVFYEEIGWSHLKSNAPMTLSPASLAFRQNLSMANAKYLTVPDLSKVQPFVIGPITDLLTFYADVFLANNLAFTHVGQHAYFERGIPNSWADGQYIILGQDSIDFDVTVTAPNQLLIKHVPPAHPQIKMTADWMKTPVGKAQNNWVEVQKTGDKYLAQIGEETFEVHVNLDPADGKIVSADLHNPVVFTSRECEDVQLSKCGEPKPQTLVRDVSLRLVK